MSKRRRSYMSGYGIGQMPGRRARMKRLMSGTKNSIRSGRRTSTLSRTGGFLGLELKFLDCAWNNVTVVTSVDGTGGTMAPSTGCTGCLSVPGQGDGPSSRDGRKYIMKSVWLSGVVDTTSSATAVTIDSKGFFFALVLDTQTNGATTNSGNVYLNPSTSGQAILPYPLRNLQNSKRYRILASQSIRARDVTQSGSNQNHASVIVNLSWKGNIQVNASGSNPDVVNVSDNSIHLIGYAGASSFTPVFVGKSRLRFMG